MSRSPMSQVLSLERYAVSLHVPLAGLAPTLFTFQVKCTGSPAIADVGTVIVSTTRSEGGGCSISIGVEVGLALLPSLSASNTAPRAEFDVGASVSTNTYQGPVKFRGALKVTVLV